jgi:hypothetical protein
VLSDVLRRAFHTRSNLFTRMLDPLAEGAFTPFQNIVQPERIGNRQTVSASPRRRVSVKNHIEDPCCDQ